MRFFFMWNSYEKEDQVFCDTPPGIGIQETKNQSLTKHDKDFSAVPCSSRRRCSRNGRSPVRCPKDGYLVYIHLYIVAKTYMAVVKSVVGNDQENRIQAVTLDEGNGSQCALAIGHRQEPDGRNRWKSNSGTDRHNFHVQTIIFFLPVSSWFSQKEFVVFSREDPPQRSVRDAREEASICR